MLYTALTSFSFTSPLDGRTVRAKRGERVSLTHRADSRPLELAGKVALGVFTEGKLPKYKASAKAGKRGKGKSEERAETTAATDAEEKTEPQE